MEIKELRISYFSSPITETATKMILAKNPDFKGNIANVYPTNDEGITIDQLIHDMSDPESKLKGLFETIRTYYDIDKEISNGYKKLVPYVIVAGITSYRDTEHFDLDSFTWLMPFDIDKDDNEDVDWKELKERISKDPRVLCVGKSVRGKGLKGIIRLKKDAFDPRALYTVAKESIVPFLNTQWNCKLDLNQAKLVQPFYLTWDPELYINWDAQELEIDYAITVLDILETGSGEEIKVDKNIHVKTLTKLLEGIRNIKEAGHRYKTVGSNSMMIGGLFAGGYFPKTIKKEQIIGKIREAVFANHFIPDQKGYADWGVISFNKGCSEPITEKDLTSQAGADKIIKRLNTLNGLKYDGSSKYIRVGDDYFYILREGNKKELNVIKRLTLIDDYGPKFLEIVPKFIGFCNEPDYFEYKQIINEKFNVAEPLAYIPQEGPFPTIEHLFQHIFGEQWNLGFAYIQIGLMMPKQKMPVLCLVSKTNETGKTTFINFINSLFWGNARIIGNKDIKSDFNRHYATKQWIMVDESKLDGHENTSKIKQMATQEDVNINEKFVSHSTIPFHGKIILLSNDERGFLEIGDADTRYWVVKVPPIKTFDPNYLEKLEKEIPAFLYYLKNTPLIYPEKKSRLWFDMKDLNTEALEKVKEFNKSPIYHQIIDKIEAWFLMHPDREFLLTQARTVWEMDEYIKKNYSLKAIGRVLKEDFNAEWIDKTSRFTDDLTGKKDIGKPWKIKNVNPVNVSVTAPKELF